MDTPANEHSPTSPPVPRFFARFSAGALTWALLAACLDAGLTRWLHADRPFGFDLLWQTLVTHAAIAVLLALVASGLYLVLPGRARAAWCVGGGFTAGLVSTGVAYFAVLMAFHNYVDQVRTAESMGELLTFPNISYVALLACVAGLVGGWLRRALGTPGRLTAAAVLVVAVTVGAWVWATASQTRQPLRGESPATFRNLLFLVMDTTRRDRLSAYGHPLPTSPTLERLAREGTLFAQATAQATYTLTSHACMLTGLLPSEHKATMRTERLNARYVSLPELMNDHGMRSAAFVANRVLRNETGVARGFGHYDDLVDPEVCYTSVWDVIHNAQSLAAKLVPALRFNSQPHWFEDHQRPAEDQNEAILSWLDDNVGDPFFLFVNYYDPHWPYLPSEEFRKKFEIPYDGPVTGHLFRADDFPPDYELTEEDNRYLLSLYDAEIAYLDHHIGQLLDRMAEKGLLEDTLLVITSDHGEYFGEHDYYSHKELYETVVNVPLLFHLPGTVPAGRVIETPVQLIDILPTIVELGGIELPEPVRGTSLMPAFSGEDGIALDADRLIHGEDYDHWQSVRRMARVGAMKLIKSYDGQTNEELYDLNADPGELRNLLQPEHAAGPRGQNVDGDLVLRLFEAVRALGPEPEVGGQQAGGIEAIEGLDRRELEALRSLGYTK